jgi:hypothetical protein
MWRSRSRRWDCWLRGTSCSSGPQPPQPGTPAFFWAAANEAYRAGDYLKTSEHLERILTTDNEFSARARAWDTVITGGVAQAYIELADTWEAGARANRPDPTPFRKQVSARCAAWPVPRPFSMPKTSTRWWQRTKTPTILLAFVNPAGASLRRRG